MRKLSIALLAVFVIAIIGSLQFQTDYNQSEKSLSDQEAYYKLKNRGKIPKKLRLQRPSDWGYTQRSWPFEEYPREKRVAALDRFKQDKADMMMRRGKNTPEIWSQAGPTNVPGRITDVEVHTSDLNTIYAGSAAGGIFKSTDLGQSWIGITDDFGAPSIGDIAIDPNNPDIIYAGTAEANPGFDSYEGNGLWRSTDAGANWSFSGLPNSYHIGRIVIDPDSSNRIYVAVGGKHFGGGNPERGIYISNDSGATWTQKLYVSDTTSAIDVAAMPGTDYIFAAMWEKVRYVDQPTDLGGATSGIWYSPDKGENWFQSFIGLPSGSNIGRIGLTTHAGTGRVYALYADDGGVFIGVYHSDNMGVTWTRTDDGTTANDIFGSWDGGWYFGQIRVAPSNVNTLYIMGMPIYKSTDGGFSWFDVTTGMHVDFHAMWIDPSDEDVVYCGNDGGVGYTTTGASNWTQFYDMPNTQFYAVEIDPSNPNRLYGGTQDNGTNRTLTGNLDDYDHIYGGDGFYVVVDPANSNTIYAEYQWGELRKSTDQGYSWSWALNGIDGDEQTNWNTPVVMSPHNNNTLFYGTSFLYRTDDATDNWYKISDEMTDRPHARESFGSITTIDQSPVDANVIITGTDDGNVWVTRDAGSNWTHFSGSGSPLPQRWITRVTADLNDADVFYVTLSGFWQADHAPHVFKVEFNGLTYDYYDITGNLPDVPCNDILQDPSDLSSFFLATDVGVYKTTNDGVFWEPLGYNMPITPVWDIDYHPPTRKLIAGTHGRSIFATIVACGDPVDDDGDGWGNSCDNCPTDYNQSQHDADLDGIGDICDECTDTDGDGYGDPGFAFNTCPEDNCASIYNPEQIDNNLNGIGDVCEALGVTYTTVDADNLRLTVGSDGNFGRQGNNGSGNVNMELDGDCASGIDVYLYDGTPVISYVVDDDTLGFWSGYGNSKFISMSNPTNLIYSEYEYFNSGLAITNDSRIAMEKSWWAPRGNNGDYLIQGIKIYTYDGLDHNGLNIGEFIDWDIPSDVQVDNTGGYDASRNLVYLQGYAFSPTFNCFDNSRRFGGMAMLGTSEFSECAVNTEATLFGGFTGKNEVYVYPSGSLVAEELHELTSQSGFNVDVNPSDQFSLITYVSNYDLSANDTLWIYTILSTVKDGDSGDLTSKVDEAKSWFVNTVLASMDCSCCVGIRGNVDGSTTGGFTGIDIDDVVYLVDYAFGFPSGPAPPCEEAPGVYPEADVDASGLIDIDDVVYLVDFAFGFPSGPPPPLCPGL